MKKHLLSTALLTLAGTVQAHPGHGATQAWHWHPTDTAGIIAVALVAALALWFTRGD